LVTFVLRIGCTIDATFIGILRHDEGMLKIECNRKRYEDSRKDLESEKRTKAKNCKIGDNLQRKRRDEVCKR
jgi:hypothetical protein